MKKSKRIAIILCSFVFLSWCIAHLTSGSVKLEMVQSGVMEKSFSFDAVVIRDETVISAQKQGVLESMVKDNEMVRRNKHVASIYESRIDEEAKTYLAAISSRIEEIKKARDAASSLASGGYYTETAMDSMVSDIRRAIARGDMEKIISTKNELNLLNDKKNVLENGADYTDDMLDSLRQQKAEYEKKLGSSKQDIFSPVAGIYSTNIDGFEELITDSSIGSMSPYDFEAVYKLKNSDEPKEDSEAVCKIIDNSDWSVAFLASEKDITGLKEGSEVYVRTKESEGDSKGRISYISTPVNGNYLVAVTSDVSCDWAMRERFVTIDLIRNKYKGLRVPVKALRVKDGSTGVYTVIDGIVHFKKVKILYKDSNYAIAEENNTSRGGLLLYDEVIVSGGKKLKEGDRIS